MTKLTVPSRQDIIDCIEKGIQAAPDLSPRLVEQLREYARTTDNLTVGSWCYSDVDCPIKACGGDENTPGAKDFTARYDMLMRTIMGLAEGECVSIHPKANIGSARRPSIVPGWGAGKVR